TRIFQRVTGLTPGRFLSAVRLQKAKQLLTSTSLTVTDISHMVGYTSVGTFSSRFAFSVGVPPRTYRRMGGLRPWRSFANRRSNSGLRVASHTRSTVRGHITFTDAVCSGPLFLGLFPGRIPQGEPVRCTVLERSGSYVLDDVPPGTYYAMACCPQSQTRRHPSGLQSIGRIVKDDDAEPMAVGYHGPITVHAGVTRIADLELRPMSPIDPPVLLALPDLRPDEIVAPMAAAA
ncbi:MAG: helix-turn-helix transcriptional regulator, partial [Jiangellaceae bacterium]